MAHEKVLIVDDEPEFTSALSERMHARGLNVDAVINGADALQRVKDASYDAIILDLQMPGMDGIETLRVLRAKHPDLQVILLSGHLTLQKGIEAVKLGAIDVVEKPADLQKLLEKIKEASCTRMLLVEKRAEEEIKNIVGKKGW